MILIYQIKLVIEAKMWYNRNMEKESQTNAVKISPEEQYQIRKSIDETNIQNTCNYMKGYAPEGKTPVVRAESQKFKINMLSVVSKRGKLRLMLYKDNMNSDKLIDSMRRLVYDSAKKVFLILDNLRVHHSKKVQAWLEKHKDEIEVFYLPPYAPEYNPDELVNSDLKRSVGRKTSSQSKDELEHNVRSHLKGLQLKPSKINFFFHAPYTIHAA